MKVRCGGGFVYPFLRRWPGCALEPAGRSFGCGQGRTDSPSRRV